jgi:hypothetical protein
MELGELDYLGQEYANLGSGRFQRCPVETSYSQA